MRSSAYVFPYRQTEGLITLQRLQKHSNYSVLPVRILPDVFPGSEAVGDLVQMLEDHASEQRQAHMPEDGGWPSFGQVAIHMDSRFPVMPLA